MYDSLERSAGQEVLVTAAPAVAAAAAAEEGQIVGASVEPAPEPDSPSVDPAPQEKRSSRGLFRLGSKLKEVLPCIHCCFLQIPV